MLADYSNMRDAGHKEIRIWGKGPEKMKLLDWLIDGFGRAASFPPERDVPLKDFMRITAHIKTEPPHLTNPPLRMAMQWDRVASLVLGMPGAEEEKEWHDLAGCLRSVAQTVETLPQNAQSCKFPLETFTRLHNSLALLYGACDIYRGLKPDYYNVVALRKDQKMPENPFSQKYADMDLFTAKLRVYLKESVFDDPAPGRKRRPVGLPGRHRQP